MTYYYIRDLQSSNYYFSNISDDAENDLEKLIKSFLQLPLGWNFGFGDNISNDIVECAISIYRIGRIKGLSAEAFPGDDNTITISFKNKEHFLDITIMDLNTFDIEYEYGIGDHFEYKYLGVKSFHEVKEEINSFSKKAKDRLKENEGWKKNLINISAFSIYNITSVRANQDFRIKHSSRLKMGAESQYLMMNVAKTNMPTVHVHT